MCYMHSWIIPLFGHSFNIFLYLDSSSRYPILFSPSNMFQQVVGIPMGTNCAPLLADLFLYSYESEILQNLVKDRKIHDARAFNFTYRYIDDVSSINNLNLQNFFHWYILRSWKLKRPPIQLRPHHFWTYTSNLTTVVNSVLKFMISGTISILKS